VTAGQGDPPVAVPERYRLVRELGSGSAARVFLAEDTKHHRQVVLKLLRPEFARSVLAERFLREISVVARLQHPHIVPLLDSGEHRGLLYFVMPFVDGETLRARLVREGRLAVSDLARLLADVADALAYAHAKGVVHRDIKPENIMLAGRHAVVSDFGVVKALRDAVLSPRDLTGDMVLGTPTYMAPEQATASPALDHRVDLYALGILGYELATGEPPFSGPTQQAILAAQVLDEPDPVVRRRPDLPPPLADLITRCLEKQPADRPPTAEAVLHVLDPLTTPSGGVTPPAGVKAAAPAWRRRLLQGGLVAAGLGLAGIVWAIARRPGPAAVPSQRQVTFRGDVVLASLSPDGRQLAFVVRRAEGDDELEVQGVRGSQPLALARARMLKSVSWSADGAELRFVAHDSAGARSLRAVPRLGGPERILLDAPSYSSALAPDGRHLAEADPANPELLLLDLARGDTTRIKPDVPYTWLADLVWSRAGDRLALAVTAFERRQWAILVLDPATRRQEIVARDSAELGGVAFTPDGRALYFLRSAGRLKSLVRQPLGGGRPAVLLTGLELGLPTKADLEVPRLTVSSDGSLLGFVRQLVRANLALVPVTGPQGDGRPLTTGTAVYTRARFSPGDSAVAFVRLESSGVSLNTWSLRTRTEAALGAASDAYDVAWSADGRLIAATTNDADSGVGVRIFPIQGGPSVRRLAGLVGGDLAWEPDGKLLCQWPGSRTLVRLDPDKGEAAPMPEIPESLGFVFSPRPSPDGRLLALYWNRGPRERGLWVVDRQSGTARLLAPGLVLEPLRWSRDGGTIYAAQRGYVGEVATLYAVPLSGGPVTILKRLPRGTIIEDVTRDGRTLLARESDYRGDAWVVRQPGALRP
jgi:dipeptidyl aminopeptidase/acylaminoacyl peptidase/tRNA A-37 threonylcarbamoyl transferase component Bud32